MSREILTPPLLRMGDDRCYRVNMIHEDFGGNPLAEGRQQQGYMEQDLYAEDDDEEEDENTFTVEELTNAHFKLTMHVPSAFYGGLIGFKGTTKRRIETETQTEINVPRMVQNAGAEGGSSNRSEDVIIKGKSRSNVCAARRKIKLLVMSLRRRMKITHFVGVPLQDTPVRENFIAFKKQILEANFPGIDESLFQSDNCIHLTLAGCVLLDDAERVRAVELLQSCREFLKDLPTPFMMKFTGLEIMNDDPSSVRVLYACVDAPILQQFANRLFQRFLQSGLSSDEEKQRDLVKLHMTVMNNRYRKKLDAQAADSFDAREILKRFANYDFGMAQCNQLRLCVLHGSTSRSQPYKITGVLDF